MPRLIIDGIRNDGRGHRHLPSSTATLGAFGIRRRLAPGGHGEPNLNSESPPSHGEAAPGLVGLPQGELTLGIAGEGGSYASGIAGAPELQTLVPQCRRPQ
ncbi:MAG: hypothetical protein WA633_19815 [Stellaceae bacterium]